MSTDEVTHTQLAENMRFYADMRFKQLTLLIAWLTLAGAGVAQYGEKLLVGSLCVRQALAVSAVIFVGVLWVMEIRASLYWRAHREKAPELWPRPEKDPLSWVNATNALFLFHIGVYLFWLYCAYMWCVGRLLIAILALIGTMIASFGVYSYRRFRLRASCENSLKQQEGGGQRAPTGRSDA